MKRKIFPFFLSVILFSILIPAGCSKEKGTAALTLDEAAAALAVPASALPLAHPPEAAARPAMTYTSVQPIKCFDNLYWVGTTSVGAFVIDTSDGLVMLDNGYGPTDCAMMVADMKKLGLDPSKIKLILLSHEHVDHYGGTNYLIKDICPNAKVALSLVGWNMLQTVPNEWAYGGVRPEKVDIYLTDGMKIKLGKTTIQMVFTTGHSPGCMSFILPVTDNGQSHMVGIMGGTAVWPTQLETRLYQSSIEYFKAFTTQAKCDVGLGVHSSETTWAALRARKPGEPNPLVIGTEQFDTEYLQKYRSMVKTMLDSGKMTPYSFPSPPPSSGNTTSPAPQK